MGKKRRSKKINQEKQRHDSDDNNNPTITSTSGLTLLYWISNKMDPNDYISHLPDNILHHIISFLPFESAVRTSFLSTHWKHLWKEALLEPVHDVITMEAATKIIQSFVADFDTHYRPRNKWGFRFEFPHGRGILVASISSKGALQLDFSAGKQELPRSFDLFLKLNLASANHLSPPHMCFDWWQLEQNHPLQTKQPSWNTMKVKSLYLISVGQLSNMAVSSLVPNLPFLQSLTIAKCNGLQSLQIKEAKGLLKLVVLDCPGLQSLSFEGVPLKSFRYRGNLVSFKGEPSGRCGCGLFLEDVMLDLRQGPLTQWTWDIQMSPRCLYYYNFYKRTLCGCTNRKRCFKSILISIRGVKSLTICRWFFETSMCKPLSFSSKDTIHCMSELKELWWIDCSMERESINALLRFLKLCPNLERLFVTVSLLIFFYGLCIFNGINSNVMHTRIPYMSDILNLFVISLFSLEAQSEKWKVKRSLQVSNYSTAILSSMEDLDKTQENKGYEF
ncbi:F-box protein [Gossypium australe]|uniref:F-box protein n=1 Tax=Gossypium australe TaxID=47621 RepID=A0A5B6UAG0_9ROSI|nr:F-box protein [Gossypium australe]